MKSLKELYRIGVGPSSSHTMAPYSACSEIFAKHGGDFSYKVELFGSLSDTGRGHGTDKVIKRALGENTKVLFKREKREHPNTMTVTAVKGEEVYSYEVISLGGGAYSIDGAEKTYGEVYKEKNFEEVKEYCKNNSSRIYEYAFK